MPTPRLRLERYNGEGLGTYPDPRASKKPARQFNWPY